MVYDITVIGGGIVGLSTAYQIIKDFPGKTILVLEKENGVGKHQTGRNSGVIHSGIYYQPGSLKANNCRYGKKLLIQFCKENDIKYEMCGKLIVASKKEDKKALSFLYDRGKKNGILGLKILDKSQIAEFEPHAVGEGAIYCPDTGIVDYSQVCDVLNSKLIQLQAKIKINTEVTSINNTKNEIIVCTNKMEYKTKFLVNCSGLYSDRIAKLSGIETFSKIIPFKGEYYHLKNNAKYLIKNLIYPVPDPLYPFLGVHFTRSVHGDIEAGPNAVLAWHREGYKKFDVNLKDMLDYGLYPGFWKMVSKYWRTGLKEYTRSFFKSEFLKSLQRLVPEIKKEDIIASPCGIRAQALGIDGYLIDDFLIKKKDNMVHVINAPSPAATSCFSIGSKISGLL